MDVNMDQHVSVQDSIRSNLSDQVSKPYTTEFDCRFHKMMFQFEGQTVQIGKLQESLKRLDLKIARSRYRSDSAHEAGEQVESKLAPTQRRCRGSLVKSAAGRRIGRQPHTNAKASCQRRGETGQASQDMYMRGQSSRQHTSCTRYRHTAQSQGPAASSGDSNTRGRQNATIPRNYPHQGGGQVGINDAERIWAQVLLAGVMATFGRCDQKGQLMVDHRWNIDKYFWLTNSKFA